MRIVSNIGFICSLLGVGGIAGAVETGEGIIPAVLVFLFGIICICLTLNEEKNIDIDANGSSSDSRPYFLGK